MIAPPSATYADYRQVCAEAAAQRPSEWTFKRDPRYTPILEHVSAQQGVEYLDAMREEFPHLWHDCLTILRRLAPLNDDLGKAWRVWFPVLDTECSPTNLRYLYHALCIWQHAETLGLDGLPIVEVGGGYGGLALYVHALRPFFTVALSGYEIIDLPEAVVLQAAYAKAIGLSLTCTSSSDLFWFDGGAPGHHLFVSCYAFSEFDQATRDWYVERLLRHCPHGFMVWNGEAAGGGPVYPFVDAPLTIEDERPLTGPGNKVVAW